MTRTRRSLLILILMLTCGPLQASSKGSPRLVIVIVIDQFRTDYLTRFREHFLAAREGEGVGGFNYLLEKGAVYWDAHYSHLATFTCVGHATILSGTAPAVSGIVGNYWFDQDANRRVSCIDDLASDALAPRTPRSMLVSTVGDELKLSNHDQSHVITLGYKDYAVISLAGRNPSLAVWFDRRAGQWASNQYYLPTGELPAWVTRINESGMVDEYRARLWDRLLPAEAYRDTRPVNVLADSWDPPNEYGWSFPHSPEEEEYSYWNFVTTPFANDFLLETALAAVEYEGLGKDDYPDILGLSLSTNDYIGHSFGPSSPEVMDVTIRTDRALARFFNQLERLIGLNQITFVLTSDHGVQTVPEESIENRGTGGRLLEAVLKSAVQEALVLEFGPGDWVRYVADLDLYLNADLIAEKGLDRRRVERVAADGLEKVPGIRAVFTASELRSGPLPTTELTQQVQLTFYPGRSGDLIFVPQPNWFRELAAATTHGTPYAYNSHVPVILSGAGIIPGEHYRRVDIRDIAPTLSLLLGIGYPSGSSGQVLRESLKR